MLYVKKNAKNQMLIYNKNKQVMAGHNQNQASASMLAANNNTAQNGVAANPAAVSNNFVKSS